MDSTEKFGFFYTIGVGPNYTFSMSHSVAEIHNSASGATIAFFEESDFESLTNALQKVSDKRKADMLIDEKKEEIRGCFHPRLLRGSSLLEDTQYDKYLKEWLGSEHKWKLIYRASEHGYSASSFHSHCDYSEPTLIIIKSSGGWIFGGYTTHSWKAVHPDKWGCI